MYPLLFKRSTFLCTLVLLITLYTSAQQLAPQVPGKFTETIAVLNLATFHMGFTSDDHTTEFDEHNKENKKQVNELAQKIARFKPTVIIVEMLPEYNARLQQEYRDYIQNPAMTFKQPSEIELLAYEVGRLSGTQKIYGIDYRENYNYKVVNLFPGSKDIATYKLYETMFTAYRESNPEKNMPLLSYFRLINTAAYLDFMININADILTHAASEDKAEGADEAAKYYHRNLVMYSNLNKVPLTKDDRVFMLMGASHTAFFNDFMRRSPKYQLVTVSDYLK